MYHGGTCLPFLGKVLENDHRSDITIGDSGVSCNHKVMVRSEAAAGSIDLPGGRDGCCVPTLT